jgi:hypothetical protein
MSNHCAGPSFHVELGLLFMAKLYFLVDGFNLYHALEWCDSVKNPRCYRKYKWNSLAKLTSCYVMDRKKDAIAGIEFDLPPIFRPRIMRLSPVWGPPTLPLERHFHYQKARLRTAQPCERSRTKPRSSAQTRRA